MSQMCQMCQMGQMSQKGQIGKKGQGMVYAEGLGLITDQVRFSLVKLEESLIWANSYLSITK